MALPVRYQIMINLADKFIIEITNSSVETKDMLLNYGVIAFLKNKGINVFYGIKNVFELIQYTTPDITAHNFMNDFSKNFFKKDHTGYEVYAVKKIVDSILTEGIKNFMCFIYDGFNFSIVKGNKKIQAMTLLKQELHPVLIFSKKLLNGYDIIESDDELYKRCRDLDKDCETFFIELDEAEYGNYVFHQITNLKHKHFNQKSGVIKNLQFPNTCVVGFLGKVFTTDSNIVFYKHSDKIKKLGDIDIIHNSEIKNRPNYYCTVYSNVPVEVNSNFLRLVSYNCFVNAYVRFGYTKNLKDLTNDNFLVKFNKPNGIISKIISF